MGGRRTSPQSGRIENPADGPVDKGRKGSTGGGSRPAPNTKSLGIPRRTARNKPVRAATRGSPWRDECLRDALGRPALHATQTRQRAEGFGVEPILGALRGEVLVQQRDLALERRLRERLVNIGPAEVAVPLGDLVLEDQVVTKRVPGQPRRPRDDPGGRRRDGA